jgi:glutaminase
VTDVVTRTIEQVRDRHAEVHDGALADYIPELTRADPSHFGIAVVTADGQRYTAGDVDVPFTIQSVSKAFAYVLAVHLHGAAAVEKRVDVEPSGEAFNEISLDPVTGRPRNPMINAGAIAITGMLPEDEAGTRFGYLLDAFSRLAGRRLDWDEEVYASESTTGFRNRAIANLLRGAEVIGDPVDGVVEDYFRQCSVLVTAEDLAVMASTLAAGGVQPHTGERVVGADAVERALSVMSTCGMYDYSGTWMYEVGIPAKSGVGGGVVGVLPGQLAIATYSPLLDAKGNSVRGVAAIRELSRTLDLHLLRAATTAETALRRTYLLSDVAMARRRPVEHRRLLARLGERTLVVELQGDLAAAVLERLVREVHRRWSGLDTVVVDLARAGATDGATLPLLHGLARDLRAAAKRMLVADPATRLPADAFAHAPEVHVVTHVDDALVLCEEAVLHAADALAESRTPVELPDFELTRHLGEHAQARILPRFSEQHLAAGDVLVREGDPSDALLLLSSGRAAVEVLDENGDRLRVAELYPGVVIGELGLLEEAPRSATVVALEPVRLFVLTRPQLMQVRRVDHLAYSRMVEQLMTGLAERLRETTREVASLRG